MLTYKVERQYFLTDAQGSTFAVLTEWGEPVNANASMSFDPFGARRDETSAQLMPWSPSLMADLDASTHHGYTGHEQVDKVGIIHMNGRIYDPSLGRFLQADPFIQDVTNSQSLNRYSYVLNNPLAFTDPTGYWGHRQQGYVCTAVAIVISVWTGYYAGVAISGGAVAQGMTIAFAGGFAAGAIQSGTGKGALLGGVSAMAFAGINGYYGRVASQSDFGLSATEYAERALANGAAGGILASIQGQCFGSGFASAGLSAALNPAVDSITSNPFGQGFAAAIVGGTVSEATGGKFGNGAITGAFAYAVGRAVAKPYSEDLRERMARAVKFDASTALASADADDFRIYRASQAWAAGKITQEQYEQIACPGCSDPTLQKVAVVGLVGVATFGVGVEFLGAAAPASFFEGATYSPKVAWQMLKGAGEFHSFPEAVGAFEGLGTVSEIVGGDGAAYQILRISGGYAGRNGTFEFIKDAFNVINHRLFVPLPPPG